MPQFNHVCIIDDDPIYIFTTRKIMEMGNFSSYIEVFKNGKEALEALKPRVEANENIPEVIFLDLNMPIMDGWQFLEEFMTPNTQKIIIYIVSSSIDPADLNKAKQYSLVTNYIVKPITPDKLKGLFDKIEK
ncbi:response regulator (plasmid) [Bernardetia sp. Wsw4-3y2]|uniref:response regulator n=1 Tax=Bernardetia sp. Wsw4-3y2 TaxID=3127471 RepID=UPI0030CBD9A4